ncbi:MAG: hypothetical protein L6V80_01535 [Bacteroidales bacterium]|nr:MAG: hypothetical protein L6V80_01535 [Bacteroidales bacterium]
MKRDRAAVAAPNAWYKDSDNAELIQADSLKKRKAIALNRLKDGMQTTAVGLNIMLGNNDARRWITELRRREKGYTVVTYPLRDRRVVYRLVKINTEHDLFSSGQEAAYHE